MTTVAEEYAAPHQSSPVALLSEWALSVGAFQRNRKSVTSKVLAAALCNGGYSYREVSSLLGVMSYIAARDAYLALVTSLPREEKRYRRMVAIDGSDVAINGKDFYIWLARDVDSGEIMDFQGSSTASAEDGNKFLARVAGQCSNRPSVRLGNGASFPRGLLNLDLYFESVPNQSILGRIGRLLLRSPTSVKAENF